MHCVTRTREQGLASQRPQVACGRDGGKDNDETSKCRPIARATRVARQRHQKCPQMGNHTPILHGMRCEESCDEEGEDGARAVW